MVCVGVCKDYIPVCIFFFFDRRKEEGMKRGILTKYDEEARGNEKMNKLNNNR